MADLGPFPFSYGETDLNEILQLSSNDIEFSLCDWANGQDVNKIPCPPSWADEACVDLSNPYLSSEAPLNTTFSAGTTLHPSALTPDQLLTGDHSCLWSESVQTHSQRAAQETSDNCPLPALDPSMCYGSPDTFPSFNVGMTPDATPPAPLRDDLIVIYFRNVHPFCPIIDEHAFWAYYSTLGEAFFESFPRIMFNAMIFAAFAHANEEHLSCAGFQSVPEAQSSYYHILNGMYQHARYQVWSHVEELVLAKVSLLLSLWCGPKRDVTTNSLWSDRAIYHTKQFINKSSSKMNPILPKRNKILYWCCIIRNTFISYAMRRPYRLCSEEMSVCDPEAVRSEFEFELLFHDYSSPGEKLRMVEDFVTICKLANNLSSILRSQRSLVFGIDWRSEEPESPVTTNNNELHQCLAKYLGAAKHESELLELKDEYEDKTRFMEPRDTEHNEEMLTKMRSYTIHLIIYSSIAAVYQFALFTTPEPWARSCQELALTKIHCASTNVALIVDRLMGDIKVEAIPGTVLAWTVLPLLNSLVKQTCLKFGLPSLNEAVNVVNRNQYQGYHGSLEAGKLLEFANTLAPRYESARDVCTLAKHLNDTLCSDAAIKTASPATTLSSQSDSGTRPEEQTWANLQTADLELLNGIMRYFDRHVAYAIGLEE